MKTGVVVNNYDPTCKNRCQIRVYGVHTQTVNGKYLILDDDLPWALPASNSGGSSGNYAVPKVGTRVYVEVKDAYNIIYYGPVEVNGSVKDLIHNNAEDSENLKVIAFAENKDEDDSKQYMKIFYLPERGLTIECNGNLISMPKYDSLEIQTKNGAGISIDTSTNDITIHTDANVNVDCKEVRLTKDAEEKIILGSKLMEKFNTHTHFVPGGVSNPPIQKITPNDFSKKVKIN
mgnify:CR=1 FL=1